MQCVSPAVAARPPPCAIAASGRPAGCHARLRMTGRTPTAALRAQCGGGTEPAADARTDGAAFPKEDATAGLAAEELELLEDEAMGGEDEGRSPTDYDRRAHIFEESSRVFRALKHRRDADAVGGAKVGAAAAGGHG